MTLWTRPNSQPSCRSEVTPESRVGAPSVAASMSDPPGTLEVKPRGEVIAHGQAVEGCTVEGRQHPRLRLLEQGCQEQGRIDPRQGLIYDGSGIGQAVRWCRGR